MSDDEIVVTGALMILARLCKICFLGESTLDPLMGPSLEVVLKRKGPSPFGDRSQVVQPVTLLTQLSPILQKHSGVTYYILTSSYRMLP
jgi:hypothetical protein